ncbi:MAG: hypothetical protein AB8B64_15645 [Granulosicoccus sp.]
MKSVIQKLAAACVLWAGSLVGTSSLAQANDGYLVINTVALHFENFDDRNAFTPGVGWEYSPSGKLGWHAGTLSDSFGYQSTYGGINYATKPKLYGKMRFMIGATILHKQFRKNAEPETKIVPLPAVEFRFSDQAVLNLSGSPQVDYGDHRNNAVLFFQLKLAMR